MSDVVIAWAFYELLKSVDKSGIFSSLALAIGSLAMILFAWLAANASMTYMVPMFFWPPMPIY